MGETLLTSAVGSTFAGLDTKELYRSSNADGWNGYAKTVVITDPETTGIYGIEYVSNNSESANLVVGYTSGSPSPYDESMIYYGFYFGNLAGGSGTCKIMHNGSDVHSFTYVIGKTCYMELRPTAITFYYDDSLIHTITEEPPHNAWYAVGSTYRTGATNGTFKTHVSTDTPAPPVSSTTTFYPPPPAYITL